METIVAAKTWETFCIGAFLCAAHHNRAAGDAPLQPAPAVRARALAELRAFVAEQTMREVRIRCGSTFRGDLI